MSDHDAEVAAVLAIGIRGALDKGLSMADNALAALTAAGIACVYVPEGVEVEHGARLVQLGWWQKIYARFNRLWELNPSAPQSRLVVEAVFTIETPERRKS